MSGRGECECEVIGASLVLRLIHRDCDLGEDVSKHRFKMGVQNSAAETELVLKSEMILI